MVKVVIGDENQLKLAEDRLSQSGLQSQVGLVIGKLNYELDKGFVYDLVPTPPNDAGDPPCSVIEGGRDNDKSKKKGAKSQPESSTLFIDTDWVSEHARQVSRLLLGGMKVVGIYIWVNESTFKNSTITLCQTVKEVAEASSSKETVWNDKLLLHIGYSPLRWTCRNCSLAAHMTSSNLRPCEFKMGKVLGSVQTFRCTYNFDIRLPISNEDESSNRRFADVLRDGILVHSKELRDAKTVINGKLVIEDELCASDDFHEVEFLLPLLEDKYVDESSQLEILGVLHFSGSVCSLAYLNTKEPLSQALFDIKDDIITSLQSRLDITCDEADRETDSNHKPVPHVNLQVQRKQCNLSFPRRVFVPWLEGTYICDYLLPSETIEVLKDHCVELMSMEFPDDASEILEPESKAPSVMAVTTKSFWDVARPDNSSVSKKTRDITTQESGKSSDLNIMLALSVIIVSLIVGFVLFITRPS